MRVLTLCGSLRAHSSNRAILHAFAELARPEFSVDHFEDLAALPHFNPDHDLDDATVPPAVAAFRREIFAADLLVISTPEYAHGLPGSFKNALDWLVSQPPFEGKPIVILDAGRGSTHALDSLREILRTMSARLLESACVSLPLGSNRLTAAAILARPDLRRLLAHSLAAARRALAS